jgi:putative membrane protein
MTMGYGYGPQWGMMGGWGGYGFGFGLLHTVIWVVVIFVVVIGVVWLVRSLVGTGGHAVPGHRSPGLDVLEERYARGEIQRDEYLQKKKDIGG